MNMNTGVEGNLQAEVLGWI